ncbi:MFS transporter [Terrarubrum flagellatum]|uniref:MFS transporter n=1 Tax=Terrirubrum flagellatum TaxID=2895980 RepID=UPI003144F8A1
MTIAPFASALPSASTQTARVSPNIWIGSLLGSTVEYYEFSIFVGASSLVFRSQFFPSFDPTPGVLLAFATSAVAYLARPLGAVLFGHLGDRIGRKPTMLATFVMMGAATVLMGLLPTYNHIGIWAAILLVALRFIQGLANGGEFGGAALMASESAPSHRRGLFASSALFGLAVGNLLGTGVFSVAAMLPHDAFIAWGWRIPFILSLFLVIPGILIRHKLKETPEFAGEAGKRPTRPPIAEVLLKQPGRLALITGARMGETILFNIATLFALDYCVRNLKLPATLYLTGLSLASFVSLFVTPAFGALSDRIGRRKVALIGGLVTSLLGLVFLPMLSSGSNILVIIAIIAAMGLAAGINNATPGAWYPELFAVRYRYTAISLGYQVGAIAGGVTPILTTLLVSSFGSSAVSVVLLCAGALILVCVAALPETLQATDIRS